jgi:hypothetical protein
MHQYLNKLDGQGTFADAPAPDHDQLVALTVLTRRPVRLPSPSMILHPAPRTARAKPEAGEINRSLICQQIITNFII